MSKEITIGKFKINRRQLLTSAFFLTFLLIGLSIYKDYGLSWDENSQWKNNGHANYNFIFHDDKDALLNGIDKYHGPAFELILVFIEKALSLDDPSDIYYMRHFLTFFVFFISSFFFYLLSQQLFKNRTIPYIVTLMYILSPAIFSHSFYNSKDIGFLSFFVISVYTMIIFIKRQGILDTFLFAFFTAIAIDIRIAGILLPLLLILIHTKSLILNRFNQTEQLLNYKSLILYLLILCPLIILFWPILWLDPIHHFIEALKENSRYPWDGLVMYRGVYYKASELPWHYLFFWIFSSRPVIYSAIFVIGVIVLLRPIITQPLKFLHKRTNEQIILAWFSLPITAVFAFNSTVFDTGRHLYFIHGAFILIAGYGIEFLFKYNKVKIAVFFLLGLSFIKVLYDMIKIHPYEHLYFNEFITIRDGNKNQFELDYWGLAARPLLENILQKDTRKNIKIFSENYPGKLNMNILKPNERKRITIIDTAEKADYYLADYRWTRTEDYIYQKDFYSVYANNAKIATAFKVRNPFELYNTDGTDLYINKSNFDTPVQEWTTANTTSEIFKSAPLALKVDSTSEYSGNITIHNLSGFCKRQNLIIKTSFWFWSHNTASAKLVASVETAEGKYYIWRCLSEIKEHTAQKWTNIRTAIELPQIHSPTDKIKIYLWNPGKATFYIDDFELRIVEEKDSNKQ
jgi:hypothetical protein